MDSSKVSMTYSDFIIDFLFWGLTLGGPASIWSLRKWKDKYSWFLNQAYNHRKIKGKGLIHFQNFLCLVQKFPYS